MNYLKIAPLFVIVSSTATAQNVGVGTAAPQQKVHVSGAANTVRIAGVSSTGTFADVGTNVLYADNDGDVTRIAPTTAPGNSVFWNILGNAGTSVATNFLGTTDAVDFAIRTSNTERIRVTSAGLIGIWWTTPATVLDSRASSTLRVDQTVNSNAVGDAAWFFNTAAGGTSTGSGIYAETSQRSGAGGWFYNGYTTGIGLLSSGGAQGPVVPDQVTAGHDAGAALTGLDIGAFVDAESATGHGLVAIGESNAGYYTAGTGAAIGATGVDNGLFAAATGNNGIGVSGIGDQINPLTDWFVSGSGEGGNFNGYHGVYAIGQNSGSGWGVIAAGNDLTPVTLGNGGGGAFTGDETAIYADVAVTATTNNVEAIYTDRGGDVVRVNHRTGGTNYKIHGTGTMPVSCAVPDLLGNRRTMFAPEAPEFLFQDFGTGQLVNGFAHIDLDPIYALNVVVDSAHPLRVFVQLEGDCNGVYVTNKSTTGFDVVELNNGQSNISFQYMVTANVADEKDAQGQVVNNLQNVRWQPVAPTKTKLGVAVPAAADLHQKMVLPASIRTPAQTTATGVSQP
jgi:hypothetical protein